MSCSPAPVVFGLQIKQNNPKQRRNFRGPGLIVVFSLLKEFGRVISTLTVDKEPSHSTIIFIGLVNTAKARHSIYTHHTRSGPWYWLRWYITQTNERMVPDKLQPIQIVSIQDGISRRHSPIHSSQIAKYSHNLNEWTKKIFLSTFQYPFTCHPVLYCTLSTRKHKHQAVGWGRKRDERKKSLLETRKRNKTTTTKRSIVPYRRCIPFINPVPFLSFLPCLSFTVKRRVMEKIKTRLFMYILRQQKYHPPCLIYGSDDSSASALAGASASVISSSFAPLVASGVPSMTRQPCAPPQQRPLPPSQQRFSPGRPDVQPQPSRSDAIRWGRRCHQGCLHCQDGRA